MIIPLLSTTVSHILSTRATPNNVTTADARVGWVSAGNGRSTSDILWSCFSILLVCTWKCIHFNIPSIYDSEAKWHNWGILYWPGKRLRLRWMYQVGWMIGIALAPEIGVAIAMSQYLEARQGLKTLKRDWSMEIEQPDVESEAKEVDLEGIESKVVESKEAGSKNAESEYDLPNHDLVEVLGVGRDEITKAHIFFANMGGFVAKIHVPSGPQQGRTPPDRPEETSSTPKTSREFIRYVKGAGALGQSPILPASHTFISTTVLVLSLLVDTISICYFGTSGLFLLKI
jgi:hypothetical protein